MNKVIAECWEWLSHQFYITFVKENRYKLFTDGIKNTVVIAVCALVIGLILGTIVAVIRVYHAQNRNEGTKPKLWLKLLDRLCGAYLAVFRGVPVVVQLLIMYYIILSSVKAGLVVAIITFGINSGAYVAEIVRAGIMSVDKGQMEAGRSLGLSKNKTMLHVILPQAFKNILPALGNEAITLFKETSVAGYVTIQDVTKAGEKVRIASLEPYFSLFFVAIVYFVIVMILTRLLQLLERRLARSDRS